jgi:hypothetical protein
MEPMSASERIHITKPETLENFEPGCRIAPNEGSFPLDAAVHVRTEDEYLLRFKAVTGGTDGDAYGLTLVEAFPPLYDEATVPQDGDVLVEGDKLIKGREFSLAPAGIALSKTAFKVLEIKTNIATIVLPPTKSIPTIPNERA